MACVYIFVQATDFVKKQNTNLAAMSWMQLRQNKKANAYQHLPFCFAERAGFEPAITFGAIHTFQACLFNHSSTSPFRLAGSKSIDYPAKLNKRRAFSVVIRATSSAGRPVMAARRSTTCS